MMLRLTTLSLGLILALPSGFLAAEECSNGCSRPFLEGIVDDFCRHNQWPHPYVCWDRQAIQAPFAAMIHNGWRRQNLLADHHFKDKSGQLTEAGESTVRWLVTEAPAQHRTIYVRRAATPELTSARLDAVQQFAAKVAPDGAAPQVLETHVSPAGYPAAWPPAKGGSVGRTFPVSVPTKIYLPERSSSSSGGEK